ncbi:hypothetical protein BpHYR1_014332 [Brachionus plicatilis]|uniref:Uncharacterized protein n=1 Tax=Brachionus plicatilis TaxID=10195 RepID=A0A3M7Q828_BRAPC|nr:hypothetical protein BpHYR1_014332 [Brachionus plicatilis]
MHPESLVWSVAPLLALLRKIVFKIHLDIAKKMHQSMSHYVSIFVKFSHTLAWEYEFSQIASLSTTSPRPRLLLSPGNFDLSSKIIKDGAKHLEHDVDSA